ncbi:MAG: ribonuclease R [Candidatus Marinimicrobia bacterium]|nr:ribonuclease R [Candidatus Neomarinimicrobiota bacterium]
MNKSIEKIILKYFQDNPKAKIKPKKLSQLLEFPKKKYPIFRDTIKQLQNDGKLIKNRNNFYGLPDKDQIVEGVFDIHPNGFGFVHTEDERKIFISQDHKNNAYNNDIVQVEIFTKSRGKNPSGKIVKIIKRDREKFICIIQKVGGNAIGIPEDKDFGSDIIITNFTEFTPKNNDIVVVKITDWGKGRKNPKGIITRFVGSKNSTEFDAIMIANKFGIREIFDKQILDFVQNIPDEILLNDRKDFRNLDTFTIDPEDAKDFDDAVSLNKKDDGNFELGVHIADVSHFVTQDSLVDTEAVIRGTSVYFTQHVIPMLPERLSNELCSLKPNVERYSFSIVMTIDSEGEVVNFEITPAVIKSKKRFTYQEVQNILDNGKGKYFSQLNLMFDLAKILSKQRHDVGSIDFDLPEPQFVLDSAGVPISITAKERLWSHRIVEEFMLIANKTIASFILNKEETLPFLYRIHEKPKLEDVQEYFTVLKTIGYDFHFNYKELRPKDFQQIIEKADDTVYEKMIERITLRTMTKAKYSTSELGHFGLAFEHYTHFTSPIRRYPDLIVHRLLKRYLKQSKQQKDLSKKRLESIAKKSTDSEIRAVKAEREYHKLKEIKFLATKINEEFDGIISGVTEYGFYVELLDSLVEGLVHIKTLPGKFASEFDKKHWHIVNHHNKKTYNLGMLVRIKVVKVDEERLNVDFELV